MFTAPRSPRYFAVAIATTASAALLLAGCTGDSTPDTPTPSDNMTTTATPSDEPSPSAEPAPSDDMSTDDTTPAPEPPESESALPDDNPTSDVPFPADLKPDTSAASDDAQLSPTGFRVGVHDDFDRVVIDFSGDGTPGWTAQYTDSPTMQGSGLPVELEGRATLSLQIDGVMIPTAPGGEPWTGPENLTPQSTGNVEQVLRGPLFEGIQEVFLGLSGQEPFRVFALTEPTRLVVDVYHQGLMVEEAALFTDEPASDAPFPANRKPDTQSATGDARLSPETLRFAVHDGFDRIVLDLAGEGTPGWLGEYVNGPVLAGSGAPVDTKGKADLQVSIAGVVYPNEPGAKPYNGPQRFRPEHGGNIQEVVYGSIFEGQLEIFIGLKAEAPFRVFDLEDHTRVVIDVQHP